MGGLLRAHNAPAWIFYGSAAFMLLTVVIAVSVDRSAGLMAKCERISTTSITFTVMIYLSSRTKMGSVKCEITH